MFFQHYAHANVWGKLRPNIERTKAAMGSLRFSSTEDTLKWCNSESAKKYSIHYIIYNWLLIISTLSPETWTRVYHSTTVPVLPKPSPYFFALRCRWLFWIIHVVYQPRVASTLLRGDREWPGPSTWFLRRLSCQSFLKLFFTTWRSPLCPTRNKMVSWSLREAGFQLLLSVSTPTIYFSWSESQVTMRIIHWTQRCHSLSHTSLRRECTAWLYTTQFLFWTSVRSW